MSTIIASGLPSSLKSEAAADLVFSGASLSIPANLTNKPFVVRAGGQLALPSGGYTGIASIGLAGPDGEPIHGAAMPLCVNGPGSVIPFGIVASLYCDPYAGFVMDVLAPASIFINGSKISAVQSASVLGSSNNNAISSSWGSGSASFSSPTPLEVVLNLFNQGSVALPSLAATLSTFQIDY